MRRLWRLASSFVPVHLYKQNYWNFIGVDCSTLMFEDVFPKASFVSSKDSLGVEN